MNQRKRSRYVVSSPPFKTSEPVKTVVTLGSFADSNPYKMPFVDGHAVKPGEFPLSIPMIPISPPDSLYIQTSEHVKTIVIPSPYSKFSYEVSLNVSYAEMPGEFPIAIPISHVEAGSLAPGSPTIAVSGSLPIATSGYMSGTVDPTAVSGWEFHDRSRPYKDVFQYMRTLENGRREQVRYEEHDEKGPHIDIKIILPREKKPTKRGLQLKFPRIEKKVKDIREILEEDDEEKN